MTTFWPVEGNLQDGDVSIPSLLLLEGVECDSWSWGSHPRHCH
jgi:hypothetical protein